MRVGTGCELAQDASWHRMRVGTGCMCTQSHLPDLLTGDNPFLSGLPKPHGTSVNVRSGDWCLW